MGGGLFNMALQGTGWVAIVSDGPPVLLNTGEAPDVRRPAGRDHLVESSVQTSVKTDVKLKNLIGKRLGRVDPDGVQRRRAGCWCSRARAAWRRPAPAAVAAAVACSGSSDG